MLGDEPGIRTERSQKGQFEQCVQCNQLIRVLYSAIKREWHLKFHVGTCHKLVSVPIHSMYGIYMPTLTPPAAPQPIGIYGSPIGRVWALPKNTHVLLRTKPGVGSNMTSFSMRGRFLMRCESSRPVSSWYITWTT